MIAKSIRLLNIGGGSAAPGLYALRIDPGLAGKLLKQIPKNIVVTGTNGKTTTSRIIDHFAKNQGKKVIRNATGSNLERGIASALINQSDVFGRIGGINLGIWELDEAAFNLVAPKIKPDVIVFLNVFRDQLDRYGEIDAVIGKWQETLQKMPKNTRIIINGDDHNLFRLTQGTNGKTVAFGIKEGKIGGEKNLNTHKREKLTIQAENIRANGLEQSTFRVSDGRINHEVSLPLPGVYNIYNFLAAFSATEELGLSHDKAIESLAGFSSAFGRVEKLQLGNKNAYIFLIKNPAGTTEVCKTIAANLQPGDELLVALNDNLADGTDISWIWDAEFEIFQNSPRAQSKDDKIYVSGTRAYDLALRLKYAGFEPKALRIQPNLKMALEEAVKGLKGRLFILPTYTALLNLQKILTSKGVKKHYWKET